MVEIDKYELDRLKRDAEDNVPIKNAIKIGVAIIAFFIIWGIVISPIWGVWARGLDGEAQLREAEWNRQIAIEEAQAELMSAELKKEADIIRAEGTAEANKIIAESITMEYIQWLWVEGLHNGHSEVIYVPTEANLPILEATRNLGV